MKLYFKTFFSYPIFLISEFCRNKLKYLFMYSIYIKFFLFIKFFLKYINNYNIIKLIYICLVFLLFLCIKTIIRTLFIFNIFEFIFKPYYNKIIYYFDMLKLFNIYFSWNNSFNLIHLNKYIYIYVIKIITAVCLFVYNIKIILELIYDIFYIIFILIEEICIIFNDLYFIFIYPLLMKNKRLYILSINANHHYTKYKIIIGRLYNFYIYFYLNMLHTIYNIYNIYKHRITTLKQLYIIEFKFSNYFSLSMLQNINKFLYTTNLYTLWYNNIFSYLQFIDHIRQYNFITSAYKDIFSVFKKYIMKISFIKSILNKFN